MSKAQHLPGGPGAAPSFVVFALALALAMLLAALPARAQDAVRPVVGTPLQAAQQLIKAGKYSQAIAKVDEANAAPNKTANETYLIARMRLAAASGAGDMASAAKAYEAASASGKMSSADKPNCIRLAAKSPSGTGVRSMPLRIKTTFPTGIPISSTNSRRTISETAMARCNFMDASRSILRRMVFFNGPHRSVDE